MNIRITGRFVLLIVFLLWLAGVVAGGSLLLTVFSLGGDSWRIALVIAVPVILLSLAAFPTTGYCLTRISPFRLRITDNCSECGACRPACRYEALTAADIEKRKPGLTCTLCGDCITRCKENALEYKFLEMKPGTARCVFIVMAASLHAIFLGAARL